MVRLYIPTICLTISLASCVYVGDGDGVRVVLSTPPSWFSNIPVWNWFFGNGSNVWKKKRRLSDETLNIRLAGIDAPECSHYGKPGQPYATEALSYLKSLVLFKNVYIKLLSKDQYGRAIAMIYTSSPRVNVSVALVKEGLAHVYTGTGAQHDGIIDSLIRCENEAKKKGLNIWSESNIAAVESPSDYKNKNR
jgi:endonuclease YncB( thermonuclease family)